MSDEPLDPLPYVVLEFDPGDQPPPLPSLDWFSKLDRLMDELFERRFWGEVEREIFDQRTDAKDA